jgi:hypothetical protein
MTPRNLFIRCFPSLNDFAFLAPAILIFCLMEGAPNLLADGDTGWHIRAGDWILDHHRLPVSDFFSFTKSGQPWFAWEWLWEVSFAWVHRQTGIAGVILGSVVVLCLTSMLLLRLVRRRTRNNAIACAVTVVAVLGMSLHFLARPHLFSFLFTVILLNLLDRRRESGRDLPWLIVPLFAVWANVHPGFLAGIIILGARTAGDLANAWAASETDRRAELLAQFQRSLLLTFACLLVPLINPYGYRLYAHLYSFLSDSYALNHIGEYKVVNFRLPAGRMFELMLFLSAPAAASRFLKREFVVPALFLVWAHLALVALRNIPFFMIVMAAPCALWLEEIVASFSRAKSPKSVGDSARGVQNLSAEITDEDRIPKFPLLGILAMGFIFVLLRTPGSPPNFRPQYDPAIYPEGAIAAVRQMGPATRMVTTDTWGGYVIYQLHPDFRVFWDGRADFYGTPYNLAAIEALTGRPGWHKTLVDNRITAVLVPVRLPLASLLAESGDWQAVYRDKVAVLFQLSAANKSTQESKGLSRLAGLEISSARGESRN